MDKLVTVFGGSGFVGTQVVRALAKKGWRVRVAVRRPHLAYHLRPHGDVGQIHVVQGHVGVRASVEQALEGAHAAVNLVGLLYETGTRKFDRVHREGAINIAEACAARGIDQLVQVSAIGADSKAASAYARSKGQAEDAVRKIVPGARIVRPSIVFGPQDDFFNRFAQMAAWSPFLPLPGGGKTRYQPVFVGDVAQAIVRALEAPEAAGQTYELGGPSIFTFEELMRLVLKETGKNRLLLPLPWTAASLIGLTGDLTSLTPIPPMLTSDQVLLLRRDNVVAKGAKTLDDLHILPTGVESIVPTYLWRYRRGGQFADPQAAG